MTGSRPAEILRHLEQSGPPDAELLARFVRHRDHAAFAELVRRHGPVVWGACCRVAGHAQDAEDAFQAAFLILARKAATLREPAMLGNWLYGVAVRVARRARRSAARRSAREVQVHAMPDPAAPPMPDPVADFGPALDEELAALPAWYRDAILLCDLRGVSREDAARALGIPEGTLSSQLANGRKKLAARLARRGVVLTVVAIPTALESTARAAVPAELLVKTCGLCAGDVPIPVSRLANGEYAMTTKLMFGVMATAGIVVAVGSGGDPPRSEPPKPPAIAKGEPIPQAKPDPDAKPGDKVAFTTKPKLGERIDVPLSLVTSASWSPDGRSLLIHGRQKFKDGMPSNDGELKPVIMVYNGVIDLGNKSSRRAIVLDQFNTLAQFVRDSRTVVTDIREYHLVSGRHSITFWESTIGEGVEVSGLRHVAKVDLDSDDTHDYAFAADGKTFRTVAFDHDATGARTQIEVREVDAATGKTLKSLLKVNNCPHALSPDGKRLAVGRSKDAVTVYDVDSTKSLWTKPIKFNREQSGSMRIDFSSGHERLVAQFDINQPLVFDGNTSERLPALENADHLAPAEVTFSASGRLLAISGHWYSVSTIEQSGNPQAKATEIQSLGPFLAVWDTDTGKLLKKWDRSATIAFHPTKPILAILEPNGESTSRLGLWDFAADVKKK